MTTLYDALLAYGKSDVYPFHMPGHKRQVEDFENPFLIDITEIDGFDNLHHPEGILKEAQERAAEVYGSRSTYFLVNGSTCGILSAVSALVRPGGEIGLARNCHKASYHACYLGDLVIHSLYPQWEPKFGINGGILPECCNFITIFDSCCYKSFSGNSSCFLLSSSKSLLTKEFNSFVKITICCRKCLFAVHHSCSGHLS